MEFLTTILDHSSSVTTPVAWIVVSYLIYLCIPKVLGFFKKEDVVENAKDFKDRICSLEDKTYTLETNHLVHVEQRLVKIEDKISNIGERLSAIETYIKIQDKK